MSHSIVALFPGQGSQFSGMNRELMNEFPFTKNIYEEASESIKLDLKKLCLDGPDDTLKLTANVQPAILTTSYAWFQVLKKECDLSPQFGAGHSLGEYTALLAAEAYRLDEAVKLVRRRGELMQEAVPVGAGKMAAIIGLEATEVESLCHKASEGESCVVAANYNAPLQIVIAGEAAAVERAQQLTQTVDEFKCKKFVELNVSAPFHSPLMSVIVDAFTEDLEEVNWKPPCFPMAYNMPGEIIHDPDLVELLSSQVDSPVKWVSCIQSIEEQKPLAYIEMGPGKVLTGLQRRIDRQIKTLSGEGSEAVKTIQSFFQENL